MTLKEVTQKVVNAVTSVPKAVIFYVVLGVTVVGIVLTFMAKSTTLKAKEMNLNALLEDAVTKLKIQFNKDKIKDLDKKPTAPNRDPNEIIDFYKKRDKK